MLEFVISHCPSNFFLWIRIVCGSPAQDRCTMLTTATQRVWQQAPRFPRRFFRSSSGGSRVETGEPSGSFQDQKLQASTAGACLDRQHGSMPRARATRTHEFVRSTRTPPPAPRSAVAHVPRPALARRPRRWQPFRCCRRLRSRALLPPPPMPRLLCRGMPLRSPQRFGDRRRGRGQGPGP